MTGRLIFRHLGVSKVDARGYSRMGQLLKSRRQAAGRAFCSTSAMPLNLGTSIQQHGDSGTYYPNGQGVAPADVTSLVPRRIFGSHYLRFWKNTGFPLKRGLDQAWRQQLS